MYAQRMPDMTADADDSLRRFLEDPRNTCPADPVDRVDFVDCASPSSMFNGTSSSTDLRSMADAARGLEAIGEVPEEYEIWTPSLGSPKSWKETWSDNGSFIDNQSCAEMSTTDQLPKVLPDQKAEVPKDLLDVIERQDVMIENLFIWCQKLDAQNAHHETKLDEHEKLKVDYNSMRSKLRTELFTLKSEARRKAKAHSAETTAMYESMQAKVDARVADWVSRHEKMKKREIRQVPQSNSIPVSSPTSSKNGNTRMPVSSPTSSPKARPATPQQTSNRAKTGAAPMQRAAATSSTKGPSAGMAAPVGSPRKSCDGHTQGRRPSFESGRSTPSRPSVERCFERSASPDASRRSKRPVQQKSTPAMSSAIQQKGPRGSTTRTPQKSGPQGSPRAQTQKESSTPGSITTPRSAPRSSPLKSPRPVSPAAAKSGRSSDGAGNMQGYKFEPGSVTPREERTGSERPSSLSPCGSPRKSKKVNFQCEPTRSPSRSDSAPRLCEGPIISANIRQALEIRQSLEGPSRSQSARLLHEPPRRSDSACQLQEGPPRSDSARYLHAGVQMSPTQDFRNLAPQAGYAAAIAQAETLSAARSQGDFAHLAPLSADVVSSPPGTPAPPGRGGLMSTLAKANASLGHPDDLVSSAPGTPAPPPPGKGGLMSTLAKANASLGHPTSPQSPLSVSTPRGSPGGMIAQNASSALLSQRSMPPACVAFQQVVPGLSSRHGLLSQACSHLERQQQSA